jgi:hypothetical protein
MKEITIYDTQRLTVGSFDGMVQLSKQFRRKVLPGAWYDSASIFFPLDVLPSLIQSLEALLKDSRAEKDNQAIFEDDESHDESVGDSPK